MTSEMRRIDLADGRQIVTVEQGELLDLISRQERASAVLVNVDESFSEELVEQLVTLHELGCNRFVCTGASSVRLHDALDERLHESESVGEVMTTFHGEDEPLDDVVALFLQLGAGRGSRLLVYVRGSSSRDKNILANLEAISAE